MTFSVPNGAGSVLSFTIPTVNLACVGGGGITDHIDIVKAAIRSDRSFTTKTAQDGVVNGARAKFTYSVTGRFQGRSPTGAATADGVYREDIVFPDTGRTCTSNNQTWTATRSTPPPPKPSVEPGTYSGRNSQNGGGVTFSVPTGAGDVLSFTIPTVNLACVGGGGITDRIKILKMTINADRSFTARASADGVLNGAKATFTYFATGYFQGPDGKGAATADGVYREDVVFTDPARTCTSNDQTWTTTRTR